MPVKSAGSVTRLALYGGARKNYGSFAGKTGGGGPTTQLLSIRHIKNFNRELNGGMR